MSRIVSVERPSASRTTASGLPLNGSEENTSTCWKERTVRLFQSTTPTMASISGNTGHNAFHGFRTTVGSTGIAQAGGLPALAPASGRVRLRDRTPSLRLEPATGEGQVHALRGV